MSTLTEKELEELREALLNKIEEHVLKYHVSLGSYLGSSELPPPIGSGTFVKFSTLAHVIYGILTAAHVVKDLKFGLLGQPAFVALSKLQNGDTVACSVSFQYIYGCVEIEGFHSESDDGYKPDIAFIALGIDGRLPNHELITESLFYDLNTNNEWVMYDPQIASAFYRGAAPKRPDGLLDTAVCIGGGERLRFDDKANLQYWEIPNDTHKSIAGGSGAGFWRFQCEKQQITPSLEGVIISEERSTYSSFEALATPYLYEDFLPKLKEFCEKNLGYFGGEANV
ncbi:MAG: hypothetical protein A3D96_06560 [Chlamydiae bacterium RIFCSPHIGHO2_12_FULL_44_59]|nr:MAG: hypothetical protein A2796_05385 [Chlamydiae bacterium RIFCSPHIGHO2_01_FULL_44_39]OGN59587.1 MAG: hypothetical protein A3D96_06560 [Chlamydiae bacterium RIFCSPHIGHO2_12_FULL_44_59]OGN68443.1 MAG: hypothetical protein A3I67_06670 [Chlamydiae bacterium RIFCSPLOWO2_02_FULL_45_22]